MQLEELKDIEPYAYEVIYPDGDGELFYMQHLAKERATEVEGEVRGLHTSEQLNQVIDYLEKKISKAGEFSNGSDNLLFRGIKSAFRDTRKLLEEAQDEEV